jgi:outer membrane lipoprotein
MQRDRVVGGRRRDRRRRVAAVLVAGVLATAGCARPPRPLAGEFPPISPHDVQVGPRVGERVRWGGDVVATTPRDGDTCFEVVAKPLDRQARPEPVDETTGRFIACATGFYDPAVWAPERELTVVGTVVELSPGKVGDSTYVYPRVRAEAVYLWPERPPALPVVVYDPWWGPFWGPYPYFWSGARIRVPLRPVPPPRGRR